MIVQVKANTGIVLRASASSWVRRNDAPSFDCSDNSTLIFTRASASTAARPLPTRSIRVERPLWVVTTG